MRSSVASPSAWCSAAAAPLPATSPPAWGCAPRADPVHVVVLGVQELLERRQPAPLAVGRQRAVERREGLVLIPERGCELARIARAPGGDHGSSLALDLVHLGDDEIEEARLI